MSVKIMAEVYESDLTDVYDVAVMLALANHADDDGVCYPSIARICKLARCSTRKAQNVIKSLSERGYLDVELQSGPRGSNLFKLNPTPRTACTPAQYAPPHATTPPPHTASFTPAQRAPETSRNVKETSVNNSAQEISKILGSWASPDAVKSFVGYRRRQKGKALSVTAASRLAENLKAIFNGGGDPDDALGLAEERGWLTVNPDWYFRAKGTTDASSTNKPLPPRPQNRLDPAIEQIARLSGLDEAQGNGGR